MSIFLRTCVFSVLVPTIIVGANFSTCIKWKLTKNEFVLNDTILLSTVHNISYLPGNYEIHRNQAHVCIPSEILPPNNGIDLDIFFAVAWSISAASIFLIIIINCSIRNTVYNFKALYCHLIFGAFCFIFLVNRQFGNIPYSYFGVFVLILELACQFLTLIWLNMFGIQLTFCLYVLKTRLNSSVNNSWRLFFFQALFAAILLIFFISLIIFLDSSVLELKTAKCINVYTKKNTLTINIIFSSIILSNCIWYLLCVIFTRKLGREVEAVNETVHKKLFKFYVVIGVILGVTFIIQLYTIAILRDLKKITFYYCLPSIFNSFQGFLLLVVFLCKSSVKKGVIERCQCVKEKASCAQTTTTEY